MDIIPSFFEICGLKLKSLETLNYFIFTYQTDQPRGLVVRVSYY